MTGRHRADPQTPSAVASWLLARGVPWWLPVAVLTTVLLALVTGVSVAPLASEAARPADTVTAWGTRTVYTPRPVPTVTRTVSILVCGSDNPGCN